MLIILGADHAGFLLKEACKVHVQERAGYKITDAGVFSPERADYPMIAHDVAQAIAKGQYVFGILICGTGVGMSMVANRYKGVRAALCHDAYTARMSRLHNNANILVMGGRVIGEAVALDMVDVFLTTPFEGGRHKARLDQFQ